MHPLQTLIKQHKSGEKVGIYSACSANVYVLRAVMEKAKNTNSVCLIEATSNQVNQYGGYTGMMPKDFYNFCLSLAQETGLSKEQMILGGDHLGPLTWTHLNEKEAMEEAKKLVYEYVLAGFSKIHIDTSMRVADDSVTEALSTLTIARRGAELAEVCEEAYAELKKENPEASHPVYVIGSEVPIPGGAQEEEGIQVTKPEDFFTTVETFKNAFLERGLDEAWENVVAVVVQPGVEFGDETIHEYDRDAAKALTNSIKQFDNLVFEGHSTDYQSESGLREMVEDGIAILKVGPALTFACREALFSLAHIENELLKNAGIPVSNFIEVLDAAMKENPSNWKKHYHGDEKKVAFKRKYSFSDRCRYYLPEPSVERALKQLIDNLRANPIPLSLLSAYMPIQYAKVRNKQLLPDPEELIKDRIVNVIDEYMNATRQETIK